jgi:hypothetical protein
MVGGLIGSKSIFADGPCKFNFFNPPVSPVKVIVFTDFFGLANSVV